MNQDVNEFLRVYHAASFSRLQVKLFFVEIHDWERSRTLTLRYGDQGRAYDVAKRAARAFRNRLDRRSDVIGFVYSNPYQGFFKLDWTKRLADGNLVHMYDHVIIRQQSNSLTILR